MVKSQDIVVDLFRKIWALLTAPLGKMRRRDDERRAMVVAAFFLFSTLSVAIEQMMAGNTPRLTLWILIGGYLLARTHWYKFATIVLIVALTFPSYLAVIKLPNPEPNRVISALVWVIVPLLLSSLIFSVRTTIIIQTANIAALLALPFLHPALSFRILGGPLGFFILTSLVILIVMIEKIKLEDIRQTELRRSQEQFYKVFHTSPDAISISELENGRIIDINKSFSNMLGYTPSECVGRTSIELNMYVNPANRFEMVRLLKEHSEINGYEFRLRHKDGTQFIANASVSPLELEGKECLIWMARDVTVQRQNETALKNSENLFRLAFHSSPLPYCITLLKDGRYVDVNDAYLQMTGYAREQVIGHTTLDLKQWETDDQRVAFANSLQATGQIRNLEGDILTKSGEIRNLIVNYDLLSINNAPHVLSLFFDITDRKRDERLIQKRASEFEALYQTAQVFSRQVDSPSLFAEIAERARILANADNGFLFLFIAQSKELEYKVSTLIPVQGQRLQLGEGMAGLVAQNLQPMNIENYPLQIQTPSIFNAWPVAACLEVPMLFNGELVGVLGVENFLPNKNIFSDDDLQLMSLLAAQAAAAVSNQNYLDQIRQKSTELENRMAELEASNSEMERFAYTVSHDLRSPLVTIKGFLGSLNKDILNNRHDRVQDDLGRIANATDKMDALLSDLLELSRVGRIINPPEAIDLIQITHDVVESLDARLHAKDIALSIAPNLPIVFGDKTRIREVMQNLIDNAAKYSGGQSKITIEIGARLLDNESIIFVKDNGMGIETQYQDRIFNLFEKLNANAEGTGIGLALVKRIVEIHGGKVWVESEGLGKGSTFCFTLPGGKAA